MERFIASGRIIDLIVALMLVEAVALVVLYRRAGRGIAPPDVLLNLMAGASLMLAVRGVLTGAGASWLLACLGVSLVAHVGDLARRWQRHAGPRQTASVPSEGAPRGGAQRA